MRSINRTLAGFALVGMFSGSVATFTVASTSAVVGGTSVPASPGTSDIATAEPEPPTTDQSGPETSSPEVASPDTAAPSSTVPVTVDPAGDPTDTTADPTDTTVVPANDEGPAGGRSSIGNHVYVDVDANGLFDIGEPGVVGIVVNLIGTGPDGVSGSTDDVWRSTVTDDFGTYLFDDLDAGTYDVALDLSSLDLNAVDQRGDAASAMSLEIGADAVYMNADFGVVLAETPTTQPTDADQPAESASVTVELYLDPDRSATRRLDEPGIADQDVEVRTAGRDRAFDTDDDVITFAKTGDDGRVTVDGLADGLTRVVVSGSGVDGLENTQDPDGGGDRIGVVNIVDGQSPPVLLFGFAEVPATDESEAPVDLTAPDDVTESEDVTAGDAATGDTGSGEADSGAESAEEPTDDAGDNSIGGVIWTDTDGDAQPGVATGEPRLAGVELRLVDLGEDGVLFGADDVTIARTSSDTHGRFVFDGIVDGRFMVEVVDGVPADLAPVSDPDGVTLPDGRSELTLSEGAAVLDANFGFAPIDLEGERSGSIGDVVFLDLDGNGRHDAGEPGVPGQTVELIWAGPDGIVGSADDQASNTTTGAEGEYLFDELPDGAFTVTVRRGIVLRATNSGDPDGGANSTASLVLFEGDRERRDQNFGYLGSNGVGDTVFLDSQGNGVDDGRIVDPGIGGVAVIVIWLGTDGERGTSDDISVVDTTNGDGRYSVLGMPDGRIEIEIDSISLPDGAFVSIDPDVGLADGRSALSVESGTVDTEQDFGIAAGTAAVGDTVWLDLDRDGVRGLGEPGLTGAMVELRSTGPDSVYGTDDDFVVEAIVDETGSYLFESLPPSSYALTVTDLPVGMQPTADADEIADGMTTVSLDAAEVDLSKDFGFVGDSGVGDMVFVDSDDDGRRDAGEPGEPGLVMIVTSGGLDGQLGTNDDLGVRTATSDSGLYLVTGLPAGAVQVSYDADELSGGRMPVSDSDGGDATMASGTLVSTELNLDMDFVVGAEVDEPSAALTGGLGGAVFIDSDRDGSQDPDESGVTGVAITLLHFDGDVVKIARTSDDGAFEFVDLPVGDFVIELDVATLPAGTQVVTETDGVLDGRAAASVIAGATVRVVDFGIAASAAAPSAAPPGAPTAPTNLPSSGTDATALLSQLAVAAMMAGMGFLLIRRRPDALLA